MNMWKSAAALGLGILLAACASAPTKWSHANLVSPDADRQYLIDHGDCTHLAVTSVAAPPPYVHQYAPPPAYTVNGQARTISTTGATVTNYSAQVQPQNNILANMQAGMAAGEAGRAQGAATYARRTIHTGCMAERGWMEERPQ